VSGGLGLVRSKLLFQDRDNRIIPSVMEILLCRRDVDSLARPRSVSVRDRMYRLMDVTDEMGSIMDKRKVAISHCRKRSNQFR
jgi:hypothetical protein